MLIVGCGDVGLRVAGLLRGRSRLMALTSSPGRVRLLRDKGLVPLQGNLDQPATLRRLAGLATRVVHLAPPPGDGGGNWWRDPRTVALLRALRLRTPPAGLVYGSTSGVYGDCRGERTAETRAVVAALRRGRAQRVYNANDDTEMRMGDYFDLAADLYGLARPPRVARSAAQDSLPLVLLSFMSESRRLDNSRLKRELKLVLKYPHVGDGLRPGGVQGL